jgi:molybdopterin synthase sulfur carrier subunit
VHYFVEIACMNDAEAHVHQPPADRMDGITVTVLYFARLREALGRSSEQISLPAGRQTVAALRAHLHSRGGPWEVELAADKPVRAAVNQDMAQDETSLAGGDEVAFFPPVTGG